MLDRIGNRLRLSAAPKWVYAMGFLLLLMNQISWAEVFEEVEPNYTQQELDNCIQETVLVADPTSSIGEIREDCRIILQDEPLYDISSARVRYLMEQRTKWNPFVLTPHLSNYILPYTYQRDPHAEVYKNLNSLEQLNHAEAKMQISFKIPVIHKDLLFPGDALYFGFTLKALWQVYNHQVSAPFRETNYRPELFYLTPLPFRLFKADNAVAIGIEHESNGQSQPLSRSWNRVYLNYYFAKHNYMIQFRPWYRIPEKSKDDPLQPAGDDNPDIEHYMGHFELLGVWEQNEFEFTLLLRNNLRSDENRGAFELGGSFPIWGKARGFLQYFNGYGESMIDYNHNVERFGIGVLVTELM